MTVFSGIDGAYAAARRRWQDPFPGFTSGQDPRTSDQALLVLTHGGLDHAARHDWLNAGRRLIDRTYLEILRHVQGLTAMRTWRSEAVAAELDGFIRDAIAPAWRDLPALGDAERSAIAGDWVRRAAGRLFGSGSSEPGASRLLFFLCPMLPVFNLSRGHLLALDRLGHPAVGDDYAAYATAAGRAYASFADRLGALPRPAPVFGDPDQRRLVKRLLDDTDWWQRRVFDELLRRAAREAATDPGAFGCDDAGQLVA